MEPAIKIANYFIQKGKEENDHIDLLKVVKLVYLAHGWHLGLKDKPLINEPIIAHRYSLGVESVYKNFKNKDLYITCFKKEKIKTELKVFLDEVWNQYKDWTSLQLSIICHKKGSPWDKIFKEYKNKSIFSLFGYVWDKDIIIPDFMIKDYYKELIKKQETVTR